MGNKHKAHRAVKSTKKCAAYIARGIRIKNRDRRAARIVKGFRPHIDGLNVTDWMRAQRRHPGLRATS